MKIFIRDRMIAGSIKRSLLQQLAPDNVMIFSLLENISEITSVSCWEKYHGRSKENANTFTSTIRRGFLITTRNQGELFA